ncbi:hypothetical protein [Geodermatophilus arenarius]|uniref:Uncharacterized protein n=1 Tax=Geodermatophilus arenarius TaxID=1137990 RepID=A0ABV9LGP5_9ACTN
MYAVMRRSVQAHQLTGTVQVTEVGIFAGAGAGAGAGAFALAPPCSRRCWSSSAA